MNAAFNGDRIAAYLGIDGHLRSHVVWWGLLVLLLFVNGCVTPEKLRPVTTVAPATQIAVQLLEGQPGPMGKLLADSMVAALVQRGFPARIADDRAALFVFSGIIETLDEQYAPIVAALHWTLNDRDGSEIAYLNQRVRGERDAWAYGSPALPITGANPGFVDFGVWIDEVTGAPGDGNKALTKALLGELRHAALPFAMTAGTASHFVQGVVDVSVTDATTEHVTILWAVSDSHGKELGRITQRNYIARGSLHQSWGKTAQYAAIGGAEAVLAIIERDLTKE